MGKHVPVLVEEVLNCLKPERGGFFLTVPWDWGDTAWNC